MEKLLQLYKFVDGVNDTPFPNATQQAILYEFRYDAKRMGNVPTISGTIMHPLCLDNLWGNDLVYVVYNGERYFLKQTPTSAYSNEDTRYKHECDFVSERIVLNDVYFYDVVASDTTNDKPVSNSSNVTFFGDIHEFAQRLNYSLQYAKVGYSVVVDEGISSEAKMISFQDQFFANALQEIYNTYEIPYYFVGKVIHIGFTNNAITRTFKYGVDDALLSITKTNANYKVVNRVTGIGSSDNIPYYYPNKYESKEQVEAEGGTWIPPQTNLMPPIYRESLGDERFYNALNKTYINPQTDDYYEFANPYQDGKPKEQIVSFEDIKPSIVGITNASGARIDMFSEFAYDSNDNDETDEEGNYLHPYFFAKLRKFDGQFGFNLFDHTIEEDEMVISMTSGNCGACNFVIGVDSETQKNTVQVDSNGNLLRDKDGNILFGSPQDRQNDTSKYEVWIALRKDIDTFGVIMPNATNNYKPNIGDTFVILHIDLPQSYISAAEERLKEEIIKYMAMNNSEKFTFSIAFSRIFFAQNPDILAQLNENARLQIEYNNKTYELYVSSYSYNVTDDSALPEIRVELSDTLTIAQNALQTAISEVKTDIMNSVGSIDWLRLGLKYFLRKDTNDRSKGKVASDVGFEVGKFVSGASGAIVYVDKTTGQTVAELDKLYVRMKAYFETLEIINVNSVGGKQLISPAGSIRCIDVKDREVDASGNEIVWDYYRCYFLSEQDGEKIENRFVVGDQAYCQLFNAQSGVTNNISNKYYWRLIVGVGENYIDLSKSDCDNGSDAPAIGDVICHRGNRNDVDRQGVIEISSVDTFSPNITLFQGIDSYTLSGKDIVSFGVDKTTNKAFMNVYGDMYVGDRNNTSYMRYTQEKGLELKGRLAVGTTLSDGRNLEEAINNAGGVDYLKEALKESTTVDGGLVQTSLLMLGYTENGIFNVMSGTNGLYDSTKKGGGIAAWYGGPMADKEADNTLVAFAQSLFRFDGSGYLAGGNISWDKDGAGSVAGGDLSWNKDGVITLGQSIKISGDTNETLSSILSFINEYRNLWTYDAEHNAVRTALNLIVDESVSFGGVGTSGGGTGSNVSYSSALSGGTLLGTIHINGVPNAIYAPTALPNPYALTINGTTYDGSSPVDITISGGSGGFNGGTITGKTTISTSGWGNQLVINRSEGNGAPAIAFSNVGNGILGYIGIGGTASSIGTNPFYEDASGNTYLLLHSGNYTDYALPKSGGTINGMLTVKRDATVPLYVHTSVDTVYTFMRFKINSVNRASVGAHRDNEYLYRSNSDLSSYYKIYDEGNFNPANYLPLSGGTIKSTTTDVLLRLNGLGGAFIAYYADSVLKGYIGYNSAGSPTVYQDSQANLIIHSGNIGSYNAGSATKLQTARSIWGNSFNGTSDINGVLLMPNNVAISAQSSSATELECLKVSSSNNLRVGYGISAVGGNTNIYGNRVIIRYSSANTAGINLEANGNVLIGATTDSGYKMQLAGNLALMSTTTTSATSYKLRFIRNTVNDDYWDFGLYAQSTKGLTFFQSSYGVDTDIAYLTGNGDLVAIGSITFGSDARYKINRKDVSVSLETIANAPLFNYRWSDRQDDKEHLGTTAQYWNNTAFKNAVIPTNDATKWTMSYSEIAMGNTIVLARELIPIKSDVQILKERVDKLENILRSNNIKFD